LKNGLTLRHGLEAGGAPAMWERVIQDALPLLRELVPAGSRVLEVGYGDGLLTCYLCRELDWRMVGLDVDGKARLVAEGHAKRFGLDDRVEFRCCDHEEIFRHRGRYKAIFIKTVLLYSPGLPEYGRWLDWLLSKLRPGGILVNFETGRANGLTQLYRRLRRRDYTDLCMYTSQVEAIYDSRFEIIQRRYYGGWSQFLAPLPALQVIFSKLEDLAWWPRGADNSFIVSIIARRTD
jgi:protein-L-isoaspartate O-methyltransferase